MRLSYKLVIAVAEQLLYDKKEITQDDVQYAISKILGRGLGIGEKERITSILKNNFTVAKIEREDNRKIYYFTGE